MTTKNDLDRPVTLKISRPSTGWLHKTAAQVLVESKLVPFYSKDEKEFQLQPGSLTLSINKREHLSFEANPGETKEFIIREGYTDSGFLLKYGFYLVLVVALTFSAVKEGSTSSIINGLVFFCLLFFWIVRSIQHDYFYIEEK